MQFTGKLFNDDGPVVDAVNVTMQENEKVTSNGRWTGTLHNVDIDAGAYTLQIPDGRYMAIVVSVAGEQTTFESEGGLG